MALSKKVSEALDNKIDEEVKCIAHDVAEETHLPEDPLQSIDVQQVKLEHELSQCMLLAKTRIRDGFIYCVESVKEMANTDTTIDLEALEENVATALGRFETVAIVKDMCSKVLDGTSWKNLLGLNDTSVDLFYLGAKRLIDSRRYPEAEAAFFFLTTIDFAEYNFWLGLGHAAFHLGNLNQAINAYDMAASCQPGSIWPHIYMANCFEALHDFEESLSCLRAAEQELLTNSAKKDHALEIDLRERIANAKSRA